MKLKIRKKKDPFIKAEIKVYQPNTLLPEFQKEFTELLIWLFGERKVIINEPIEKDNISHSLTLFESDLKRLKNINEIVYSVILEKSK